MARKQIQSGAEATGALSVDAEPDADATPTPPPNPPPPREEVAALVAVTRINLNGLELEPGAELPADEVATLNAGAIAELLESGVVRQR